MGIVLNRPGEVEARELMPALEEIAGDDPLFIGGPVQPAGGRPPGRVRGPGRGGVDRRRRCRPGLCRHRSRRAGRRRQARALLRRVLGLGPGPARDGDRDRLVDRRAAASRGALPGRPGVALERRARAKGRLVRSRLPHARRPEHELDPLARASRDLARPSPVDRRRSRLDARPGRTGGLGPGGRVRRVGGGGRARSRGPARRRGRLGCDRRARRAPWRTGCGGRDVSVARRARPGRRSSVM